MKDQRGYAVVARLSRSKVTIGRLLCLVWRQFKRWHQLDTQRRQLASLSDAGLKDLGLSRADIYQESERPFWDDPLKR